MKIKKIFNRFILKEYYGIEIGILISISLIAFLAFLYGDFVITSEHGIIGIKNLFTGTLRNFYHSVIMTQDRLFKGMANYELPIYIIFMIWNIPLKIYQRVTSLNPLYSVPCLLYANLILILFVFISFWLFYKICKRIGFTTKKSIFSLLVFATSLNGFFVPVFMIKQYDIIPLSLMLAGVYCFLEGKKKLFVFFFAIANTMKFFSLIIFIPMLLLKEKRIIHIVWNLFLSILGITGLKLFYYGNLAYNASISDFTENMLNRILNGVSINGPLNTKIIGFILIYALICIYCFNQSNNSKEHLAYIAFYMSALSLVGFLLSLDIPHPYWFVLPGPFLALIIVTSPKKNYLLLFLVTVYEILLFVFLSYYYDWVYGPKGMLDYLILKNIQFPILNCQFPSLRSLYDLFKLGNFISVISSLTIASILAFFIYSFPKKELWIDTPLSEKQSMNQHLIWFRLICIILVVFSIIFLRFIPNKTISIIDLSNNNRIPSELDLGNELNRISQIMKFDKDSKIKGINFYLMNDIIYMNRPISLFLTIEDIDRGQEIYSKGIPLNTVKGGVVQFKMKNLLLSKNVEYRFKLKTVYSDNTPVYLAFTDSENQFVTYENENISDKDLVLTIYSDI